jgi:hypothetical protein
VDVFTKRDVKSAEKNFTDANVGLADVSIDPSYRVHITREQFQSSEFMQKAREVYDSLPKNSKLLAFARDFAVSTDTPKGNIWKSASTPAVIHPEEYITYGIHAHLQPIFEKTDATLIGLLAAAAIQLLQGKDVKVWIPEYTYYNGMFLRHGDEISGKLPTTADQLREWNPAEIRWR